MQCECITKPGKCLPGKNISVSLRDFIFQPHIHPAKLVLSLSCPHFPISPDERPSETICIIISKVWLPSPVVTILRTSAKGIWSSSTVLDVIALRWPNFLFWIVFDCKLRRNTFLILYKTCFNSWGLRS